MYRNVTTYTKQGVQYVWESTWDEEGKRIEIQTPIEPYLFYEDNNVNSKYKSLFNKPLRKMVFTTQKQRNDWINRSMNIPLFEKLPIIRQYLLDKYFGQEHTPQFSQYPFRTFYLDIEIETNGEFPDQTKADYPINVISIYNTLENEVMVWCYQSNAESIMSEQINNSIINDVHNQYDSSPSIHIIPFNTELDLLKAFVSYWTKYYPDIVSGWNSNVFDMPYIINRLIKILGDKVTNTLSPVTTYKPIYPMYNKKTNELIYKIHGVSLIDYLPLYKKFAGTSKQSFKLDAIAKDELNLGKFDYYDLGYESLEDFMRKDFPTFIKYNIIDSILVRLIDKKLGFITLMRHICNIALCEYDIIYKSIPQILGALTIQARINNVKFLTDSNKPKSDSFDDQDYGYEGAFVFPTTAGYYKNGIMSFDFNSLYPNVMMTVNISPDTKVGKILNDNWLQIVDNIRNGSKNQQIQINIRKVNGNEIKLTVEQFQKLIKEKCTVSANGVLYLKPALKFGIIPQFLDKMYKQRVKVKNQMKKNKKKVKQIDQQIQKLEEQLKTL